MGTGFVARQAQIKKLESVWCFYLRRTDSRSHTHKGDSQGYGDLIHFPAAREVSMARFDLTDFEWDVIQPLLPT
ncbi:MAG: hypothetical protein Q8Q63_02830, partial [Phaeovulum sp.]|uniref:hypothetical protein n=1 Tax=Phaeovulum sp. TaxID=2934796 RepID=UPI002734C8B2